MLSLDFPVAGMTKSPMRQRPGTPSHRWLHPSPLKHMRYSRDMTIIAGFVHSEGILLCSDMEVTIAGTASKRLGPKLMSITGIWGSMGIALWGNPDTAIAAVQKMQRRIGGLRSGRDLLDEVDEALGEFYRQHVFAHPSYATQGDLLAYGLILAIYDATTGHLGLYGTSEDTIREMSMYKYDGIGRDAASSLMQLLYEPNLTKDEACTVASYAISVAKRMVPGCGGPSLFMNVGLSGEVDHSPASPGKVGHLERVSEMFNAKSGRLLLKHMCEKDEDFNRSLDEFVLDVKTMRSMWKPTTPVG